MNRVIITVCYENDCGGCTHNTSDFESYRLEVGYPMRLDFAYERAVKIANATKKSITVTITRHIGRPKYSCMEVTWIEYVWRH